MLVLGFPAQAFGTNCYVLAPAAGEECLVIDPGVGVVDQLTEVFTEYRLRPAAVLATHGHFDHIFAVTPVCDDHGIALSIHSEDRYRLVDPLSDLDDAFRQALAQQFGLTTWKEPDDIVTLEHGQRLAIAGIDVGVIHAPGHTEGSVMFDIPDLPDGLAADTGLTSTLISGDVLFENSIGRTDLPGGSADQMAQSLRERVLPLKDETLVLTGHGNPTTIGQERATNPYLRQAASGRL
jgi:hydroxyacylglutathione hydrolase